MKENRKKIRFPKPKKPFSPGVPALEWLSDVSGRTVRATLVGSRRIMIENHTGIEDFSCEQVRLNTIDGSLCICGCNLSLCEVRRDALIVHGCIRSIALPEKGDVR